MMQSANMITKKIGTAIATRASRVCSRCTLPVIVHLLSRVDLGVVVGRQVRI